MRLGVISKCPNARRSRWALPTGYPTAPLMNWVVGIKRAWRHRVSTPPAHRLQVKQFICLANVSSRAEGAEPKGSGLEQAPIEPPALGFRNAYSEYHADQSQGDRTHA
jgi:hypothetical protein